VTAGGTGLGPIVAHLRGCRRVIVASHERPDGDAIGSGMAAVLALRAIGVDARMVVNLPPPPFLAPFPGVDGVVVTTEVTEAYDAAVIMECGDLARTGIRGLDRSPVINIDHHLGNTVYGAFNWVDESAAACGELAFDLVEALGAPLTADIATHVYLGVLTDTGSFHFSHISPRTFEIAKRCVEAGASPQWIARTHYDSNSLARVKLWGAVLAGMQLDGSGRVAALTITPEMTAAAGGTYDDTEGLINFPLTVKDVQAAAFFKQGADPEDWRVSMRSKAAVDVGAIARRYDGGGHKNASGCSVTGTLDVVRPRLLAELVAAVDAAGRA
jgi:bifunctional oligoribonuclease and PAP phosphatase NrnA